MKYTIYITAGLLTLLLVLQPDTVESSDVSSALRQWMTSLRQLLNWRPKRDRTGCPMYACAHNQIAGAAARRLRNKEIHRQLILCAMDPTCSPGKRRKRSTGSLDGSAPLSSRSSLRSPRRSMFLDSLRKRLARS